jgi:hypothetical protein
MKSFRATLAAKDDIEEFEMQKIWKGFYFCMWMSDKVPVQQELARTLAASMHMFKPAVALKYYQAFLQMMSNEYINLDQHRVNKFMSLIRRCVEASFIYCRSRKWDNTICKAFADIHTAFFNTAAGKARAVVLFVCDIFVNSWAKSFTQDIFFRELSEDDDANEEEHIHIDLDNNDVEAALAQASRVDVSPIKWATFQTILEPIFVLFRFTSDQALRKGLRDNVIRSIVDVMCRLAEHAHASTADDEDEDADEDSEANVPAPQTTDALAPTLLDVLHDFVAFMGQMGEDEKYAVSARKQFVSMHAEMKEIRDIFVEMGIVEAEKPKVKAKKPVKAAEPAPKKAAKVAAAPAAETPKSAKKKAKKAPVVEDSEEELEEVPELIPIVAKKPAKRPIATVEEAAPAQTPKKAKKAAKGTKSAPAVAEEPVAPVTPTSLERSVSFGTNKVKPFFKKVPPAVLHTPKREMLSKVAGPGLLKQKKTK